MQMHLESKTIVYFNKMCAGVTLLIGANFQ